MDNKEQYVIWGIIIMIFLSLAFLLVQSNASTNQDSVNCNSSFSNEELETVIIKMLKFKKDLFEEVESISNNSKTLFFMYSKDECSTCVDNALVDIYLMAKKNEGTRKIMVITPKLDEKYKDLLYNRYDGYLTFICGDQKIWDEYKSEIKKNYALFFTVSQDLDVSNSYVYSMHKEEQNISYFNYIQNYLFYN